MGIVLFIIIFLVVRILATPIHELGHIITGKLLGGYSDDLHFLAVSKKFNPILYKNIVGWVSVHLPSEKEKFRWIVDMSGGWFATIIFLGVGVPLINTGSLPLGIVFLAVAGLEFVGGLYEIPRNKKKRNARKLHP